MAAERKIALVTGGGTGIGRACAVALARAGFTVAVCGRRKPPLEEVARECGGESVALAADVARPDSVEGLFREIKSRFGRLDLLFNNAGIGSLTTPIEDVPLEKWRAVVGTNLTGSFLCLQAAFRLMKEQNPRGGRIINNGSLSAITPRPHAAPYTASKHALTGLTKAAALEGRKHDIACGQIDIGPAATPGTAAVAAGLLQADFSVRPEPTFELRHMADAVVSMAKLPLDTNVPFLSLMPTAAPFIGRG